MKKILRYMRTSSKKCLIVLMITFLLLGIQIIIPMFSRYVLNSIEETRSYYTLLLSLAVYAILLVIYNLINVCWYCALDYLGGEILGTMRTDLMKALFYAPYKKIMKCGLEKVKNILYADTLSIYSSLTIQVVNIVSNLMMMLIFSILSFYVDKRLGIALVIVELLGFIISLLTRKKITNASGKVNKVLKKNNKVLNEYVDSLETARNNNLLDYFIDKELEANKEFIVEAIKSDKYMVALKNLTQHFHKWASLFISAFLLLVIQGNSGDLVFILLVLDIVLGASEGVENSIYQLMKSKPSFEYVNMLNELFPEKKYDSLYDVNEIQFNQVSFGYDNNSYILENLSENYKKGDIVHVKGKNGSGKTTFLKLLTVLLQTDRGSIFFDGKNVNEIDPKCISKLIVYVSQDETFLNESFSEYLRLVTLNQTTSDDIERTINELVINRENNEIENLGKTLSGGQRKKLLFAKLKLREKKTPIIIMDELESAMDKNTKEKLCNFKRYLYNNREKHITFVISHDDSNDSFYTRELYLK